MFNIGWAELLVLIVAGLFVFGPERLPGAVTTFARGLRQVRDYATGAKEQLRAEMGPEFDELRKPLQDLGKLRATSPKQALARHLFVDNDPSDGPAPRVEESTSEPVRFDKDAT